MSNKSKFVSCVTYMSRENIVRALDANRSEIAFAEFIFHDKDEKKELHAHINLEFYSAKMFTVVQRMFNAFNPTNEKFFTKETVNTRSAHDYLTHLNAPSKYQYDAENIVHFCGCLDDYLSCSTDIEERKEKRDNEALEKNERAMELIDDIIACMSTRQLIAKYGRDYMRNRTQYHQLAQIVMIEEGATQKDVIKVGRDFCYMMQVLQEAEELSCVDDSVPFENLPIVEKLGGF